MFGYFNKILVALIFLIVFLSSACYAGINGLTIHSRANCGNNESISWNLLSFQILQTDSYHYHQGKLEHSVSSYFQNTWRSAAVCWGEAGYGSGWSVIGKHWTKVKGDTYFLGITSASNCNIYDGWWDYKK